MRRLRVAASLLTRIRVGATLAAPEDLARSVTWFPVVGGLVGLVLAGIYVGARTVLPPFVAAGLAVAVGMLLTGGFHEDGLADTADALGGGTREEALRILKDPAHGTYGVLALALSVLLRSGAIAALDGWTALAVLPAAHALSRAAPAALLGWMAPAAEGGMGATFASSITRSIVLRCFGVALVLGMISMGVWVVPASVSAGLGTALVGWVGFRKLGGVTGDLLGAAQQVGEVAVLLIGSAAAASAWPGMPWWR